ncbi:hypothetical protein TSUD_375190 [Trifolium subterraneum]|uniref:MULE transposase domain-containing protein n=1 Tax=Trifolium subterraneum TaxID=3900 RepID=A0A2Z6NV61_TRISU|nr:hypothetical protein TSUD_375190 [Trifolium subterraneum]
MNWATVLAQETVNKVCSNVGPIENVMNLDPIMTVEFELEDHDSDILDTPGGSEIDEATRPKFPKFKLFRKRIGSNCWQITSFTEEHSCHRTDKNRQAKTEWFAKRPLIGLDACFLKGDHGGQLMAAVGKDGNNQMIPIVYAVVDAETRDSW